MNSKVMVSELMDTECINTGIKKKTHKKKSSKKLSSLKVEVLSLELDRTTCFPGNALLVFPHIIFFEKKFNMFQELKLIFTGTKVYTRGQMFICSISGFPTESKTHEQDEDLHQCVFSICPCFLC